MQATSSFFQELLNKKRSWSPSDYVYVELTNGADELLNRALAARVFELDVGAFVQDASKKDLPVDEAGAMLLHSNVKDETVHDTALNRVAATMPWQWDFKEVEQFKTRLKDIAAFHHPILMARSIEVGIFFVVLPILKLLGNAPMKVVSSDIINDEKVHVAANSYICNQLKLHPTPAIKDFVKDVVFWITEPLRKTTLNVPESLHKFGDADFWMRQSDNLLVYGKSPEMNATKRTAVVAFFETNKNNQPYYR